MTHQASATVPFTVYSVPQSIGDFESQFNQAATSPLGTAAMFITAMIVYTNGDRALAEQMLARCVDHFARGQNGRDLSLINKQSFAQRITGKGCANSLVEGAVPENGYRLPPLPWRIHFDESNRSAQQQNQNRPTHHKVFVLCSGASSRPMTLVYENGQWRVNEWSSLTVDVRVPPMPVALGLPQSGAPAGYAAQPSPYQSAAPAYPQQQQQQQQPGPFPPGAIAENPQYQQGWGQQVPQQYASPMQPGGYGQFPPPGGY